MAAGIVNEINGDYLNALSLYRNQKPREQQAVLSHLSVKSLNAMSYITRLIEIQLAYELNKV